MAPTSSRSPDIQVIRDVNTFNLYSTTNPTAAGAGAGATTDTCADFDAINFFADPSHRGIENSF
jgi:hypothetical protein